MGSSLVKQAGKRFLAALIFFNVLTPALVRSQNSPINGIALDLDEKPEKYSILLGGHLYGGYNESLFPSPSLLASIDSINAMGAKFFVSLGDMFQFSNAVHISKFQDTFAFKLKMPLFNAVGNTDIDDRELYESRFGETYHAFTYNKELFVFLDSEVDDGSIRGPQMEFFRETVRDVITNPVIEHVFVFSHRLLWVTKNEDFSRVFKRTRLYYDDNNFQADVEPILTDLAKSKKVYCVAGENGVGSFPLFYYKHPDYELYYLAVALGDTEKDVLLLCTIGNGTAVRFSPVSLTGQEFHPITHYNLDFWADLFDADQSLFERYRGKVTRMVQHYYFWMGVLTTLVVGFPVLYGLRKWSGNERA
jgi:hypothetical protein